MSKTTIAACLLGLATFPATAGNWKWDFDENFVGGGIADADWTIDKVFPGTKLIVDMRFVPKRELKEPGEKWQIEDYWATVEADMQWGEGETGLEYGIFSVNAFFETVGISCVRRSANYAPFAINWKF